MQTLICGSLVHVHKVTVVEFVSGMYIKKKDKIAGKIFFNLSSNSSLAVCVYRLYKETKYIKCNL